MLVDIVEKKNTTLLNAVTTNQQTDTYPFLPLEKTIEAWITGSGSVSASIAVYGANTKRTSNGILIATLALSGTNADSAGAILASGWSNIYAVLTGITGTGAAVTLNIAV